MLTGEILSPSTESKDRRIKLPIYPRYGVAYAWLVDPLEQTLETLARPGRDWQPLGVWRDHCSATVRSHRAQFGRSLALSGRVP